MLYWSLKVILLIQGVPNSHVTSTLEATLKKLRERRLGQESSTEQPPEPDDADISPGVAALQSTLAQQTQEQATKFKPSPKFVHQPVSNMHNIFGLLYITLNKITKVHYRTCT